MSARADEALAAHRDGEFDAGGYRVEVGHVSAIPDGVQVFARAWLHGAPVGFGPGGTVETERIRVVNPPTMVPDGTFSDRKFDRPNGKAVIRSVPNFRKDPADALRQAVLHTVRAAGRTGGRIVPGSVGNTVTTVYSDAADAVIRYSNASFATARAAATGDSVVNSATAYISVGDEAGTYNFYIPFFMFDTSGIAATDVISGATMAFSLVGDNSGTAADQFCLLQSTQATWNSIVTADFDQRGYAGSVGAARLTRPVAGETGYQTFTLNATGLAWISKSGQTIPASSSATGKTQLAVSFAADVDNSAPAANDYNQVYFADQAGTTNDPVLVVTHAAPAGPANVKTWDGLAQASVKTANGLAIASVKTADGLN